MKDYGRMKILETEEEVVEMILRLTSLEPFTLRKDDSANGGRRLAFDLDGHPTNAGVCLIVNPDGTGLMDWYPGSDGIDSSLGLSDFRCAGIAIGKSKRDIINGLIRTLHSKPFEDNLDLLCIDPYDPCGD